MPCSPLQQDVRTSLQNQYNNTSVPIDKIFLVLWITLFLTTIAGSYFAEPLPTFNFFTILIIGSLIFLFSANFLGQIMYYLQQQLLNDVFTAYL